MLPASQPRAFVPPRPFYGWIIVLLSWFNQGLGYTVWYSFSIFFVALIKEFGWDRGGTAAVFSWFLIVGALAGPVVGALIDRFGPRLVLPFGAMSLAAGTAICAFVDQLWQFYLAYGLLAGFGMTCVGWVPNNAVVSRWFVRRLGAAAGLASTGVGVGIFVLVPQVQRVIEQDGWRSAFLALALLVAATLIPLNALLQRGSPAELGLRPDGDRTTGQVAVTQGQRRREVVDRAWAERDWTLGAAARTWRFWLLSIGFGSATFAQQLLIVHQVAYLIDAGQPTPVATGAAALYGLFAVPMKALLGTACDRYGRELTFSLGTGAFVLAFPILTLAANSNGWWLLLVYAVLVGTGLATIGPIAPGMVADVFGGRSYGLIFGSIVISTGLGGAFGAWWAGWIFDLTGDYRTAFASAIGAAALAIVCSWLAAPRRVRRIIRG